MLNMRYLIIILGIFSSTIYSTSIYAWDNNFKFINNFNAPLVVSIYPATAEVTSACGDNIRNIIVGARDTSCAVKFADSWFTNSGKIVIAKKSDPTSYCSYNYSFTESSINYFRQHSENLKLEGCNGSLSSNEISVVNDRTQSLARPMYFQKPDANGNPIQTAIDATESLSQNDCAGVDNCMIVSPNLTMVYEQDGSSLTESLQLQNSIDRYEPFNFAQFIGSHNAAISQHYTKSTSLLDLSYSDPNNYLSLTDQLDLGLRMIELDVEWDNDAITICHNPISASLQKYLCDNNIKAYAAIAEIKSWIEKHRDAFVILYLDVNLPLKDKVGNLDADLAQLEPYVFTSAMANQYYHVANNTIPAARLTKNDLLNKFGKNILVVNDNNLDDLKNSKYVFINNENSTQPPLYHKKISEFFTAPSFSCEGNVKYASTKQAFADDPDHYNMFRINEDRILTTYVLNVKDKKPGDYVDYFSTQNIKKLLQCPFNLYTTNMLGYTCSGTNCEQHPTEPRMAAFLWSWELGYPLKNSGSNIAYIDLQSSRFKNNKLDVGKDYGVLCYHPAQLKSPVAALNWYLATIKVANQNTVFADAQAACSKSNGVFAVPTTSYAMGDAINAIKPTAPINNVIVNYATANSEWVPNMQNNPATGNSLYITTANQ